MVRVTRTARSTLFPYTTLFRSRLARGEHHVLDLVLLAQAIDAAVARGDVLVIRADIGEQRRVEAGARLRRPSRPQRARVLVVMDAQLRGKTECDACGVRFAGGDMTGFEYRGGDAHFHVVLPAEG